MRTNVYVDGFNLYFGCLKGTAYKWLDLDALAQALLGAPSPQRIRYFTARIKGRDDPAAPVRQDVYLRALGSLPNVSVHLGSFVTTTVRMPLAPPPAAGPRTVAVSKTEEKGSDVNLATCLLADAFRGDCDAAVVVTNDSDLASPVRVVARELGIPVGLINPHRGRTSRTLLEQGVGFVKPIRPWALAASQLPDAVAVRGRKVFKPPEWA
jgi:hypothetical protein